jgi:predicted lipoprotein with Yx(FWY)xxD motif
MPVKRTTDVQSAPTRRRFPGTAVMLVFAVACFAIAGLTGLALARTNPTFHSAQNSSLGKTIAVDSRGLTVYELSPETTHHLLCTKANGCFAFWPPVTVRSARTKLTASGVKGKLGILHRNGLFQVTLGGRPLYHFALDHSKRGAANGQGLKTFGGTWHTVVTPATHSSTSPPPMTTTTTTTTTPYPY